MEPQVQYATTSDGVSIACASMGEGMPAVSLFPPGTAHVQPDWAMLPGEFQRWTRTFRLIWYDPRGSGLSDRDAIDFSMEAMIRDLQAVVGRMGLESFALFAATGVVPVAVTYAATFPDRVSHLILLNGWTKFSDSAGSPGRVAFEALIDKDWTLFTETMGRVLAPSADPGIVEAFGRQMRASIEPEAYRAFVAAIRTYDVSALLPHVKAPTLVLHNASNRIVTARAVQKLAAGIPDARFLSMEEMTLDRLAGVVEEFVGAAAKPKPAGQAAVHTILFTDIEGSTTLTQRLGDARAQELLRAHNAIVREALKGCGGSEIKHTGDGIMASFPSASRALECAIAIQREVDALTPGPSPARRERGGPEGRDQGFPLRVRIGLNAGEPVAEDADLFGTAVQLARRICDHAGAGEILVSNVVRELAAGKGFLFADTGEVVLKGFEEPVRLHAVRWREDG